jgi:hypothetical protein
MFLLDYAVKKVQGNKERIELYGFNQVQVFVYTTVKPPI